MHLNVKVAAEVGIGLVLWFGFIISMAITNGLLTEMRMDIEGDHYRWRWPPSGVFRVTRAYRARYPETKKPDQMWFAYLTAILCMTAIIGLVWQACR
jgi:uncharacterized membrane protein